MDMANEAIALWQTSSLTLEQAANRAGSISMRTFLNSDFIAYIFPDRSVLCRKGAGRGTKVWAKTYAS